MPAFFTSWLDRPQPEVVKTALSTAFAWLFASRMRYLGGTWGGLRLPLGADVTYNRRPH
jgi:hypothetical protein